MTQLAILLRDSSNRVYSGAARHLAIAELRSVLNPATVEAVELGGVGYLRVELDDFDDGTRFALSNLSATYALFEVVGDELLQPCNITPLAWFPDDLISIQKYPGKTNEQFTQLLINVTVAASPRAQRRATDGQRIRLLDPVAGRGSTLNRALVYGFDATGIEVSDADVDQYRTFITTYLKQHRVKHRTERERVKKGPLAGTSRFHIDIAAAINLEMVRGDAIDADVLLAGRTFDVIVGDLPYGVQHRAGQSSRSPAELLESALPAWKQLTGRGLAIGLSWNLKTMPRSAIEATLSENGFSIVDPPMSFEHQVDRSITRDLIVAHT